MTKKKTRAVRQQLSNFGSAVVAFSGGVDSTLLLKLALDELKEKVLAVTAASETYPASEVEAAVELARQLGARHQLIHTDELQDERFACNPTNRCYYCKTELFSRLKETARQEGMRVVVEASNADDVSDFRPGRKAARELGILSPLLEAGLTKAEIREVSRALGLPTWNKPSYACLASRFPYGSQIEPTTLTRLDAAEDYLRSLGFSQVRVRHHGDTARIEVLPEEMPGLLHNGGRESVMKRMKELGYTYVTLDLQGYRTGSMNETLTVDQKRSDP